MCWYTKKVLLILTFLWVLIDKARLLILTDRNYNTDRKALAIIWALDRFKDYLERIEVTNELEITTRTSGPLFFGDTGVRRSYYIHSRQA